jgi:hypothetical protein
MWSILLHVGSDKKLCLSLKWKGRKERSYPVINFKCSVRSAIIRDGDENDRICPRSWSALNHRDGPRTVDIFLERIADIAFSVWTIESPYKVCLINKCKCGQFYCMWDLIRNYAYLWSDKVVKKGHILSLISSAVLSYLILHKVS